MYCEKCGKEIDDNAVICVNCGAPTKNFAGAQSDAQPERKTNLCGIFGFCLSIIAPLSVIFHSLALYIILTLAGLVLSIVGLALSKNNNGGRGLSLAGFIISLVAVVLWLSFFIMYLFALELMWGFLVLIFSAG